MHSDPVIMGKNSEQRPSHAFSNKKPPLFFAPIVQHKLTINRPGDIYEQEADAMADKIMRVPDPSTSDDFFFKPAISSIHRRCANCEEDEKKMQRKENSKEVTDAPSTENDISPLHHGESINEWAEFF